MMKILHIPQGEIGRKNLVSGIKSVLLEEVKWENTLSDINSKIYINDIIEEDDENFINNKMKINDYNDILKFNPDFVIFDGFYDIKNYWISRFLIKNNIKYYIKPHGSLNSEAQKNGFLKIIKKYIGNKLIFNKFIKKSQGLIYLNINEEKNSIYKNKNSIILSNGIEENENNKIKTLNDIEEINIIFLGKIDFYTKGIDKLTKVVLENKEYFSKEKIKFNFYGNGILKDEKRLYKNFLDSNGVIKIYEGIFEKKKKYQEMKKHDIYILLSRYEGMPMAILESLSLGIPCFVSKGTGMGEIIEENDAGWYWKENQNLFEELKKAIEDYKNNKEQYQKNSLKLSEKYLWKNLIKEYEKEYKKIKK